MSSDEESVRWFENPLIFLWSYYILVTTILTYEHCRIRFESFDEFCIRIENAIASFFGFIRASISGYEADTASGNQEDDFNRKLRENAFAEEHEEGSPIAPKRRATTSSTVKPRMQIGEVHPNKMFSVKSMDKKIITSNTEESISCEGRRGNEEENNAMLSETGKFKLWKSLDQHVVPGSKLTLGDPSVSLDEQCPSKQMNLPEVSADVDKDEGDVIADSKRIFHKSGPGIEKRRFSCEASIRRNSSDFTSNHKLRGFMRSVSFAGTVSILRNIETTDDANETDQRVIECNIEHSDASNFWDEISLDDPIPVLEPNCGSKIGAKNQEQQENADQKLNIDRNAQFLLRSSLSLDLRAIPGLETDRLFRRASKMEILKNMEEKWLLEEEDEDDDEQEFRLKKRPEKHETDMPACTEEYDREFPEAGNSSVEDVGVKDSTMEETID